MLTTKFYDAFHEVADHLFHDDATPRRHRRNRKAFMRGYGPTLAGEGTYWSGTGGVVVFTPDSTSVSILTINNTGWAAEESNLKADVTNGQSGNHKRFIPTINDTTGSFDAIINSAAMPSSVGLFRGTLGTLLQYYGNSGRTKSQYVLIEKVAFKVECQGGKANMYTVTWQGETTPVEG